MGNVTQSATRRGIFARQRCGTLKGLSMRILIVEDDPETAAYVSNGLAEEGHSAETIVDGRDGLSHAMEEVYDVLVVDRTRADLE